MLMTKYNEAIERMMNTGLNKKQILGECVVLLDLMLESGEIDKNNYKHLKEALNRKYYKSMKSTMKSYTKE